MTKDLLDANGAGAAYASAVSAPIPHVDRMEDFGGAFVQSLMHTSGPHSQPFLQALAEVFHGQRLALTHARPLTARYSGDRHGA